MVLGLLLQGCGGDNPRTTITFWHFWSEPSQKRAVQELIVEFETANPSYSVSLTELNWADGKAKLQLAFNSGTAPDVIHVGLDWIADYERAQVLKPLPRGLGSPLIPSLKGAMWTVNTRAWLQNSSKKVKFLWGLPSSDAHNVVKRVLPLIWLKGSPNFCTSIPLSLGFDATLVDALWRIRTEIVPHSLIQPSKTLDEEFIRGNIQNVLSGTWMIDIIRNRGVKSVTVVPTKSILNGDVLCIPSTSKRSKQGVELISFLTSMENSLRFCKGVSDAGFPSAIGDSVSKEYNYQGIRLGFFNTVQVSVPLPSHESIAATERVIEDMIVASYAVSSIQQMTKLVLDTKERVKEIERRIELSQALPKR